MCAGPVNEGRCAKRLQAVTGRGLWHGVFTDTPLARLRTKQLNVQQVLAVVQQFVY